MPAASERPAIRPIKFGTESGTYLFFSFGGRRCGLPTSAVREIQHICELGKLPGLPRFIEGMMQLGADVIPVIRPERLFDLPEDPVGLYSPVIRLRAVGGDLAILVREVERIVTIATSNITDVTDALTFNGCVSGETNINGDVIPLLDPDRILLEQERRAVDQFAAIAQSRVDDLSTAEGASL